MIKGLAITPPVLGRITIGKLVERNGKRLPQKDDQFTLTTQIQTRDGWVKHPFDAELRHNDPEQKLRSIPVRMLFNDPDLNLRAEYTLFNRQSGRPLCIGDGQTCQRLTENGQETLPCPGPALCDYGKGGLCKVYGRLNVVVHPEGSESVDPLGSFIFRTTGFNSIRTLAARLSYFQAVSGQQLSGLDLVLRIRGKSTALSHRTPIFYVDLTLPDGVRLEDALQQARERIVQRETAGWNQKALEEAAKAGFANAFFEETPDDLQQLLEEFYPSVDLESTPEQVTTESQQVAEPQSLAKRLKRSATQRSH